MTKFSMRYGFAAVLMVGIVAALAIAIPESASAHWADIVSAGLVLPATSRAVFVPPLAQPILGHRARGLVGVRADAGNAAQILDELKRTFEAFKASHTEELAELKKKIDDPVTKDRTARIDEELTKLQESLDQCNAAIAAMKVGGASNEQPSAEKVAHRKAFHKFFRKGVEDGLRDLEVKAAMTTDSDPDGGYVVPEEEEATIDRVLGTVSSMRSLARVMTISRSEYKKLVNQGGAGGGWVGEKESRPETDTPQLAELSFPAMELYANPAATQGLLDDARVDIGAWLGEEVSITFAELEGAAFISGTGVKQPRGLLSYAAVADASYAWGSLGYIASGVSNEISDNSNNGVDALTSLAYALKKGYRNEATFLMNRTLVSKVRKLKTIGDTAAYLWQPSVQAGEPATLLGYPLVDDDNMPNVGANAYPIAFGNFRRGYLIVDRAGIRVLRDPYTNKPYVMFYTTKRVGGGIQNFEAIKLLKCATS